MATSLRLGFWDALPTCSLGSGRVDTTTWGSRLKSLNARTCCTWNVRGVGQGLGFRVRRT